MVGGGYEHGYVQVVDPVSATVFRFMAVVVQRVRSARSRAECSRGICERFCAGLMGQVDG